MCCEKETIVSSTAFIHVIGRTAVLILVPEDLHNLEITSYVTKSIKALARERPVKRPSTCLWLRRAKSSRMAGSL